MILTVNEVRARLFKLVDPVMRTREFHRKYDLFSDYSVGDRLAICEKNWNLTMAYIHSIASHLNVMGFPDTATRAVPPEIILTAFVTYSQVTRTLIQMDQERKLTVPDLDADFLLYMFVDFLGKFSGFTDTRV